MSDTVLGGDWTIYYLNENRQKRLSYTGSGTTYTVNQLYSALQDHFDESTQMDDGTPMFASTPTAYRIGTIDAGDNDPWFIDHTSVEYLSGGAIETVNWDRVEGSNTGIIRVTCATGASIVAADIGQDVTHTNLDSGTLLDVYDDGSNTYLWIRPDTSAAANSFDDTSGTITSARGAFTATQSAAGVTGELLWTNIYNTGLATLQSNTHQYIEQNGSLLTAYKNTSDWWGDGQFDILVQVKEPGTIGTGSSEIDYAKIRVLARKYSSGYAWFETDLSAGGRNPIPLTSLADLDNTTGYSSILLSGATGNFTVGDRISDDATNAHGIITQIDNPGSTPTLHYYLVGDPIDDFANSETVTNLDDTGTGTVNGAPSSQGPALAGWYDNSQIPDITFGHATANIDETGAAGDEDYSITIDCKSALLAEVWEFLKYQTRRSNTGDIDAGAQTIEGQFYRGIERRFEYTAVTSEFANGDLVYFLDNSDTIHAIGTVAANDLTKDELMMYGYYVTGSEASITRISDAITYAGGTKQATIDSNTIITPVQKCPFGDFAGGTFFGAEGVLLTNYAAAEANSFQLKDNQGTVRQVPTKISVTVGNTRVDDKVAVFRLDGNGDIDKDIYSSHASSNTAGATSFVASGNINADEPGKTNGGILRVVAVDELDEHRYRFSSWATATFTLATTSGTSVTSGTQTSFVDIGADLSGVQVGDIIANTTENTYAYITNVDDGTDTITTTNVGSKNPVTDWNGDDYVVNGLVQAYDSSDTAYVPLIDSKEDTGSDASTGSESVNITYVSPIDVLIRTRNATNASYKMLPYAATGQISGENFSNNVIRSSDDISSN